MIKILKYALICAILAFNFFPVKISFIPIGMNRIVEVIGLLYLLRFYLNCKDKYLVKILRLYAYLLFLAIAVSVINAHFDFQFYFFILSPLFTIGIGIWICNIAGKGFTLSRLCDLIIIVQCIQAVASFAIFLNPSLGSAIQSIFTNVSDDDIQLGEYRLIGIGNTYINAAVNYGVATMLLTLLPYLDDSLLYRRKFLYITCAILIATAGILSARTYMFVFVPIALFLFCKTKNVLRMIGKTLRFTIIVAIAVAVLGNVFSQYLDFERYEHMISWAFEVFKTYEESGEIGSSSSTKVVAMYEILPDNVTTWVIGDGWFSMPENKFYMDTDIGYGRHLFYWGLLGLLSYIIVVKKSYWILRSISKDKTISLFLVFLLLFEAMLNFKGILNFGTFVGLILSFFIVQRCQCNKQIERA